MHAYMEKKCIISNDFIDCYYLRRCGEYVLCKSKQQKSARTHYELLSRRVVNEATVSTSPQALMHSEQKGEDGRKNERRAQREE